MNVRKVSACLTVVWTVLTLTACSSEWGLGDALAEPQPLVFTATQGTLTADTRAATDGTWTGDGTELVAIQIDEEVKKYKVTAFSGTLTPYDSDNTFYRTDKNDLSVTAWYPYSASKPDAPTIANDQKATEKRESSNLMTASATAVYGQSTALAFSHQTARLRIYLTGPGSNTAVTEATVRVSIGGNTYIAHEDGNGYYSVLVAPGATVSSGQTFLRITTSTGASYEATATAGVTFTAGNSYDYNFALKRIPYLTFTATAEQGFNMTLPTSSTSQFTDKFQYSVGGGAWTTVVSDKEVTFGGTKGTLRLRGVSSFGTSTANSISTVVSRSCKISFTNTAVSVNASGDIRTLVDYKNHDTADTKNAKFCNLFNSCTALVSAPELPATELADYCYICMFQNCTGLTTAPVLSAKTLTVFCYRAMFNGCTKLTKAPELPATKLASQCYQSMFSGCTSLVSAPELLATELADSCYYTMFSYCSGLTTAPALPAMTLKKHCYWGMFQNCTSLQTAPDLPTTTIADYCYNNMFYKCTGLKKAPKRLPAETLATYCYESMFQGCTALTKAPDLPAKTLVEACYSCMFQSCSNLTEVTIRAESTAYNALSYWLNKVASSGTIHKRSTLTLSTNSASGIPKGWTATDDVTDN